MFLGKNGVIFFSSIPRPWPKSRQNWSHQAHGLHLRSWSPGGRPCPGDAFSSMDRLVANWSPPMSLVPSGVRVWPSSCSAPLLFL